MITYGTRRIIINKFSARNDLKEKFNKIMKGQPLDLSIAYGD